MEALLHRHQLVHLTAAGWRRVRTAAWDDEAGACLDHWAAQRLPLVVTRQARPAASDRTVAGAAERLDVGLAAPLRWQRRRLAIAVDRGAVASFDEFPRVEALADALPQAGRSRWRELCAALAALDTTARVYGSRGWQLLTGMPYVHPASDVDLWLAVRDAAHADAVAARLDDFDATGLPRLDGELFFASGRAVAWREWRAWRAGRCRAILAKTLSAAVLVPAVHPSAHAAVEESAAW